MLENNPLIAIKNNVSSTKNLCEIAINNHVEKMVLISTDKAVRPTSLMGATKRLAEMILQAFSTKYGIEQSFEFDKEARFTKFCMVRFGNVLGSSGSVVPLFQEQIDKAGPITLIHPEIIRYFMTIK